MSSSPRAPFPPLLDLREAGWPEARVATAASVTAANNRAVSRAAEKHLDMTDHVYGFGHLCDILGTRDE